LHFRFNKLLLWAAPAAWLGCGGGSTDVVLPSLSVSTATTGVELDPDGYSLVVDGGQGQAIGLDATLVVDRLPDGTHSVGLSGMAQNCVPQGDNPRAVTVTSGATASVAFAITCSASSGSIHVITATTGSGSDPDGFALLVDGADRGSIGVSATVDLNALPAGTHTLGLTGLAANCQVVGDNPQPVAVAAGQTIQVSFSVNCSAAGPSTGTLQITTSTGGANQDTDGYTVTVDGRSQPIGPTATVTLANLSAAAHTVRLGGVATNCTVAGANPARVTVPNGGTAGVAFTITCVATGPSVNLRIAGLYLTQSTQTMSGSIPLVQNRRAFLRVFAIADGTNSANPTVRVRFYRAGAVIRELTINSPGGSTPTQVQEGTLGSSWNQAIDASLIQPDVSVLAEVDPDKRVAETNENDNVFPVAGSPQALTVQAAALAKIRFVPILQPGQSQPGNVTSANKDQLVSLARKVYPLNAVETSLHATFPVGTSLQADGTGWSQVLTDLDGLRVAEGSDFTYYGVARLDYGSGIVGMGFVGEATAMGTDAPADVIRVTAHELGHTWNELHTPCGNPPNVDPGYPYGTGIGVYGFDVAGGTLEGPSTPDIMGYCSNPWISDYTFKRVMGFRKANFASAQAAAAKKQPTLLIWGRIINGQPVLEPAFQVTTRPSLPAAPGPYSIEATASDGSRIFALSFDAKPVADDPQNSRHFAFAVPLDQARAAQLSNLRLLGPGARVATMSQSVARVERRAVPGTVVAHRETGGQVRLQWNAAAHPLVMVRDPDTGEVLAFARGGDARVWTGKSEVDLELSDGVRSQRVRRVINRP
jgi:hypothetical protein